MSAAQAIKALQDEFPDWSVTATSGRWRAERATTRGGALTALAIESVATTTANDLRDALEVFARIDEEILLRRLAEALRRRGRRAHVYGATLVIPAAHTGDHVITCGDGRFRWDGGWPIGPVAEVDAVADLIDRRLSADHTRGRSL